MYPTPLDFYQSFQKYSLPYQNLNSVYNEFSFLNVAAPFIQYIQNRFFMFYLCVDPIYYLNQIVNNIPISFPTSYQSSVEPNFYTLTDSDQTEFLSFIGNMIGLPPFTLIYQTGFILGTSQLSVDAFGQADNAITIPSQAYANFLLARFYKFYNVANLDTIIKTIILVADVTLEDLVVTVDTQNINVQITFPSAAASATGQLYLEYLDPLGYNLWMKPQYGLVNFTYLP